jgi:small subunit ribosomal protein S2e
VDLEEDVVNVVNAVSVLVNVVVVVAAVEEEVEEEETKVIKTNGSQSPSLVVWSRMERSNQLKRSFCTLFQSRNIKIVDTLIGPALRDEVMKIMPVQKQTTAGQRTRFKAYVAVGDGNGHIGLGLKCAKEVATSIRGAIIHAKMNLIPVRRGYWGANSGSPHTVPMKVTGKCGSVRVRLIPAPRGSGIVASVVPKKLLNMAGIEDVYSSSKGHTKTRGNLAIAVYAALSKTYSYLTPDLWTPTVFQPAPTQEHTDHLTKISKH